MWQVAAPCVPSQPFCRASDVPLTSRLPGADDWGAELSATVQLGGVRNPPPSLTAIGSLRSHDAHTSGLLSLATSNSWSPLPNRLPGLVIPQLSGRMSLDSSGVDVWVEAAASSPEVVYAADLLVLRDWFVIVSATMHSTNQVDVNVTGAVAIGGSRGFVANVTGILDSEEESVELIATSEGGWVPFASALPQFVSPAFVADLTIGGEHLLAYHATAHSPQPVDVIDNVLQFTGTGVAGRSVGPALEVCSSSTPNRTHPHTLPLRGCRSRFL